jgi:hypothetical protein
VLSLLERIAPVGEQQHCEHQANFDRR